MKKGTPWSMLVPCLCLILAGAPNPATAQEGTETRILASAIVDHDVVNEEGEKIGEVDDLVIRRSGKVKKVTLEVGGYLDVFDKRVALSFSYIQVLDNGDILVDATKKQLNQKPEFSYFEKNLRPEYYYRSRPLNRPPYYSPPGYSFQPEPSPPPGGKHQWTFSPSRYLATVIMDRNVINEQGRHVGTVEDLVIDEDEEVSELILSSDRILGEDQYVSVPFEPLGFSAFGLVYDITRQELMNRSRIRYED